MEIKILQVFLGADGLPYKDQERTVHFPIVGSGFQGASNTTKIRFYYDELVEQDDTETAWVACAKLPNGKIGSKVLETDYDSTLGEHYALLELDSFYFQYKGDVYISLQGYQGGVQVDYDEETELYTIYGTPTIAATGSIKLSVNYATQFVGSGETSNVNFQRILADLGTKLGIRSTSVYVEELPTVGNPDTFYVIHNDLSDPNKANIYIWNDVTQHYIWVGDNTLDLDNYYTQEQGEQFESGIENRVESVENELSSVASGSPKGVYATLTALQTAFPSGDDGIYVVEEDGKWYYWDGTQWSAGGTYLAANLSSYYTKAEADNRFLLKYQSITETDAKLDYFEILPTEYYIKDSIAISQDATTKSFLISKMYKKYTEVHFKFGYNPDWFIINLLTNENNSIGFRINYTSGNVILCSGTGYSQLSGIARNTNCRSIVVGDEIVYKNNGNKIAYYLNDNNVLVPIFEDEWIEPLSLYSTYGFTNDDIGCGLSLNNSYRHEQNMYDLIVKSTIGEKYVTEEELNDILGDTNAVNLVMFMGQSNIAGRGTAAQAPVCPTGQGFEFRAITDPTKLYDIIEPFGVNENLATGIDDEYNGVPAKTGDLVSSFIMQYYKLTKTRIVGVSASEGGTRIGYWLPTPIPSYTNNRYNDAVNRFNLAKNYLENNGYTIKHKYIVWCQGESDGDDGLSKADYKTRFMTMANAWFNLGIEKIFIIRIGNNRDYPNKYDEIIAAQTELCQEENNIIMISTKFVQMSLEGLMNDQFHFTQQAYNLVGNDAATNMAFYDNNDKEPTMYDFKYDNLYYSHK